MNTRNKTILTLAIFCLGILNMNAQKVGYVNSQEIIAVMPAVQEANSNLETYGNQLQKRAQQLYAALEGKYESLRVKQESGEISPKQLEVEAAGLQQEEQKLREFQSKSQADIAAKQNELLEPILKTVQDAIDEIAKAGSYTYIFDSSQGVILYADESTNITAEVKAKLGM